MNRLAGCTVRAAVLAQLLVAGAAPAQDAGATGDAGTALYLKYCSQCHGEAGDGKGIATRFLNPAPRDFTSGKYKVRTTPTGALPTDDDLRRAIRTGLPYSAMPAFPDFSAAELDSLVVTLKAFSPDFEDPDAYLPPIEIPDPPPYTPETVSRGEEVYAETGCARCHGDLGRGDGGSAPTLVDDWDNYIKIADLTKPWTFRGGGTRRDIFRTMSTGFSGTPMPGFHGSLPVEDIWSIVDYMVSLSGGPPDGELAEASYSNLLRAVGTEDELDLERGKELFRNAPPALFPLLGQIIEPGRNFYPSANAVEVRAVYNEKEIAFEVTWHDMRAETSGSNGPELQVPLWDEQLAETGQASGEVGDDDGGGFWGDEEGGESDEGDFWGDEEEEPATDEGDFWGEEGGDEEAVAAGSDTEFSDAVALQFPLKTPEGIRRPYFLFGDTRNPADVWFADLGTSVATSWAGRGSKAITPNDGADPLSIVSSYDQGEWSVIIKRKRKSRVAVSFEEDTFIPIAFSVWDGFNRERGNKRAISVWYAVYLEPMEKPSPTGPMARAGIGVLGLELLIIALVRRKYRKKS